MAWPVGADDGGGMMEKFLLALVVGFGATSLLLYTMNKNLAEKNASLEQALASQAALLQETQAELQLRDDVIKQRDAAVVEAERKKEQKERQYAKLLRDKKDVRDWDSTALPDDVLGMLQAGADRAAGPTCDADGRGGNP
jgi:uncharacterized protein HemX